ncbi:hypothetical protein D3C73_1009870 [compost metagenome]
MEYLFSSFRVQIAQSVDPHKEPEAHNIHICVCLQECILPTDTQNQIAASPFPDPKERYRAEPETSPVCESQYSKNNAHHPFGCKKEF